MTIKGKKLKVSELQDLVFDYHSKFKEDRGNVDPFVALKDIFNVDLTAKDLMEREPTYYTRVTLEGEEKLLCYCRRCKEFYYSDDGDHLATGPCGCEEAPLYSHYTSVGLDKELFVIKVVDSSVIFFRIQGVAFLENQEERGNLKSIDDIKRYISGNLKYNFAITSPSGIFNDGISRFVKNSYEGTLATIRSGASATSRSMLRSFLQKDNVVVLGDIDEALSVTNSESLEDLFNKLCRKPEEPNRKKKSKVAELKESYLYKDLSIIDENKIISSTTPQSMLFDDILGNKRYAYKCPSCGKTVITDSPKEATCNHCQHTTAIDSPVSSYGYRRLNYRTSSENEDYEEKSDKTFVVEDHDGDFVVRIFEINRVVTMFKNIEDLDDKYKEEVSVEEIFRVFFRDDQAICISLSAKGYVQNISTLTNYKMLIKRYYPNRTMYPSYQTCQEVIDILKRTNLKRSGVIEYFAYKNKDLNERAEVDFLSPGGFLYNYYSMPKLEIIAKAQLCNIVSGILSNKDRYKELNLKGTSPTEILEISKPVMRVSRNLNLTYEGTKDYMSFWEKDQQITPELYDELMILNKTDVVWLLDNGLRAKDIVEYLKRVNDYQCIKEREACSIWRDYLEMAKALEYKLNSSKKYPSSLKREHDKAIFAYRSVQEKMRDIEFKNRVNKLAEYKYSPEDSSFEIIIPKKPEDVISEGVSLNHCVAVYVKRICEGESKIVFLREKEDSDKSFYTIEIQDDKVTQVKGFSNKTPSHNSSVDKFVKRWADNKNLKIVSY